MSKNVKKMFLSFPVNHKFLEGFFFFFFSEEFMEGATNIFQRHVK